LQKAVNVVSQFNLNGFSVTVNVAAGTYAPVSLKSISGSGTVNFVGNNGSPATCLIRSTTGISTISGNNAGSAYSFSGFGVAVSGSSALDPGVGITVSGSGTVVSITNFSFGACIGGHLLAGQGALINIGGTLAITGGSAGNANSPGGHMIVQGAGQIFSLPGNQPTLALSGTPNFAGAFAFASYLGGIQVFYTSVTGSATGQRYSITSNAVINTNGGGASYFPGNSAGTTATGGQYI
jgi:hypothetical protein